MTAKALTKHFSSLKDLVNGVALAAEGRPGLAWLELSGVKEMGPKTLDSLFAVAPIAPERPPRKKSQNQTSFSFIKSDGSGLRSLRLNTVQQRNLLHHYGSDDAVLAAIAKAKKERPKDTYYILAGDSAIGTVATDALIDFFSESHNLKVAQDLFKQIKIRQPQRISTSSPISGKVVVFTGSLERMTREEAKALAERFGAKVTNVISKNTDLLVAGAKAGSKLAEARKHSVQVISEEEWLRLVGGR
jgi:DNA ligase (NAD+)